MNFIRGIYCIILLVILSGCALVIDNGRYADIVKSDRQVCLEKRNVVFYVDSLKMPIMHWMGTTDANFNVVNYYSELIKEQLNESGCFDNVELTKIQLSKPPQNYLYLEFDIDKPTVGFVPFLNLVLPISYRRETSLQVTAYDADDKKKFELNDYYAVSKWLPLTIVAPFFDSDDFDLFYRKKENDIFAAMFLKMKNEGFLKAKSI